MDFGPDRTRIYVQGDRLSSLPDDLIFKILAHHDTKFVIRTSALSSRWKYTWKSMPDISFSSDDFTTLPKFSQFVTYALSHRNNHADISSLNLSFRGKVNQPFVKKVINYALSHNVQKMSVTCLEFPLSVFNSQSLKDLTLIKRTSNVTPTLNPVIPTITWDLPALLTLHLEHVTFDTNNPDERGSVFSKCTNLKNLTLTNCKIKGLNDCFTIDHPNLSSLTLENGNWSSNVVNVVAPHLENLIIRYCNGDHLIYAPGLTSLVYKSQSSLQFSAEKLSSLEKVVIHICDPGTTDAIKIVAMFRQFHNVKFLTLGLEIVEVLSSYAEVVANQPSPFANLKSLTIYPEKVLMKGHEKGKVTISPQVKNYLLFSSPSTTFKMFSREEIKAIRNTASAKFHMAELRLLLDQEKAKENNVNMQRAKAQNAAAINKPITPTQPKAQVERPLISSLMQSCWEELTKHLTAQIQYGKAKTDPIIKKMQSIEELLRELPESNKANMQECFSSLCTEANAIMKKIIDRMKGNINTKESRLRNCYHELTKTANRKLPVLNF